MNVCLSTCTDNIIIHNDEVEIHHNKLIQTIQQYDLVLVFALKFLNDEGFFAEADDKGNAIMNDKCEVQEHVVTNIIVIDLSGEQVIREQCL
jgi:hypothetical protein